ncbi:MAG: hypothetical protein ACFE9L_10060 [Candidatus Hodarchaeota archaeon]
MKEGVISKQTRIGSNNLIIPNNIEGAGVSRGLVLKLLIIDDDVGMSELFKLCLLELNNIPKKKLLSLKMDARP